VRQIAEFLFGDGFATAEGELWKVRRRAVGPSLHKGFLETMTNKVFGRSALELNKKLEVFAETGTGCSSRLNVP
jgi:carotene epsilon-monooxygenase